MRIFSGIIQVSLLLALFLVACKPSNRVSRTNLSYIYSDDPTVIHPQYKYFHESDQVTTLHMMLPSAEILYSKNNVQKIFQSRLVFLVNVYEMENENKLVLSDTVFLYDTGGQEDEKYLLGKSELDLPSGKDYFAELTLDDQFRMQFVQDIVIIRKKEELTEGHFKVFDLNGQMQFTSYNAMGSVVNIKLSPLVGKGNVEMRYFKEQQGFPTPPFSDKESAAAQTMSDSGEIFTPGDDLSFQVNFKEKGIYQFTRSNMDGNGLSLMVAGQEFPFVRTVKGMIRPLRYITTRTEFSNIEQGLDPKKELDAFWYNLAGNAERARESIKTYYTRVEMANKKFTSDRVGWKTDRGLVYIIYGPPNTVAKNSHGESWVYNEKNNMMSVEFNFFKIDNPFTDNDFVMNRSGGYKSSWYRAIDNWRQGRVF